MTFMPERKIEAIQRVINAGLTLQNSQARELWDALTAAEARIATMAHDLEDARIRLAVYRQWEEEARLKLSGAQAYLAMLDKHVIADDMRDFLIRPLPGEEDR